MESDSLSALRKRAEASPPPVRAAALMRIARVESVADRAQARRSFESGLEEARRLSGFDRDWLLEQARVLAAAVAPDLIPALGSTTPSESRMESVIICRTMILHGHWDAAYEYVMHFDRPAGFPFGGVSLLMQRCDKEAGAALVRRAVKAWRAQGPGQHSDSGFLGMFRQGWKTLPADEARDVTHEIVRSLQSGPDRPVTAAYGFPDGVVTMTSSRQVTLFQIFHILRQLDPALAESVTAGNAQLAGAVRRFPNGLDSMEEEAGRRRAEGGSASGEGHGMAGHPGDFGYLTALLDASRDGEFGACIEDALESYRQDAAPERPNLAPREFWPSTYRFRSTFYRAGMRLGRSAARYLERIPDEALRLFAEIEFEAALAGLPELGGTQHEYRPGAATPHGQMPHIR